MLIGGRGEREILKKAQLSFTPMIDAIFLLLIYFLVTMKFKELDRQLEANLPQQGESDKEGELLNEIWIFVKIRPGTENTNSPLPYIVIDQVPMADWDQTRAKLETLARVPGARKDPVLLVPDPEAHHGWVMKILDYLNQLGYKNINFKQ